MHPNHSTLEAVAAQDIGAPTILMAAEASMLGLFCSEGSNHVFDRITRIARLALRVPLVLMSVRDHHRQWYKSVAAEDEIWTQAADESPTRSICQLAAISEQSLCVRNVSLSPLKCARLVPSDASVGAYLASPIRLPDGRPLGSLCAVSATPREWSGENQSMLADLAALINNEIKLRWEAVQRRNTVVSLEPGMSLTLNLFDHSSDCIKLLDAAGSLTFMNASGQALQGVEDISVLLGRPWVSMWPEASRPLVESSLRTARIGQTSRFRAECPMLTGDSKWWDVAVSGIMDRDGNILSILAISRDITREKHNADALRESETKFKALANNITQFAWMADASGELFWYNQRWFNYTGTTLEQMFGWGWKTVHHPDHVDRVVEKFTKCLTDVTEWEDTFPLRGKDGTYRWFLSRAVPILNSKAEVQYWFGTNTDVTEQLQTAEELRRASQAKDNFIAVLSHELRTPLNPVLLIASEAMTREDLPEHIKEDFNTIRKSIEMEARLIDDLLDLTRITHGKLQLVSSTMIVADIINETVTYLRSEAAEKSLLVVINYHGEFPVLQGDDMRLRQVLWNILRNSIKFTPANGTVSLSTGIVQNTFNVTITDTGIGMSEDEIAHVFEPFRQGSHADVAGVQRFGGLGLGLGISRMLVEMHGGSMAITSPGRNQGTTVVLTLPFSSTDPQLIRSHPNLTEMLLPKESPLNILLVEDHEPTRQTLSRLLQRRGHTLTSAATLTAARQLASSSKFDLLVSDIGLPDGRGDELMRELRVSQPDLLGIALSGYGMEADIQKSKQAGFSQHLTKPVSLANLEKALRKMGEKIQQQNSWPPR